MKKNIVAVILAVVMVFSLAACGTKPVERCGEWVTNPIDGIEKTEYVICVSKNVADGQTYLNEINKIIKNDDIAGKIELYMDYSTRRTTIGTQLRDLFLKMNELRDRPEDKPISIYSQLLDPYDFSGSAGAFADGIDIYITEKMCENLNRSCTFYERSLDYAYEQVKSGKGDILATAIALNDQVKQDFLVSDVYSSGYLSIVSDKNESYTKIKQLKGKVIGVVAHRLGDELVTEKFGKGGATIVRFDTDAEAKVALQNENVDVLVIDELSAKLIVSRMNAGK